MDEQTQAARTAALAAGFTVAPVTGQNNQPFFQLSDAQGNYLATARTEDALWSRAFKRGLLPAA